VTGIFGGRGFGAVQNKGIAISELGDLPRPWYWARARKQVSNQHHVAAGGAARRREPLAVAGYGEAGDPLSREGGQLSRFAAIQGEPPDVGHPAHGLQCKTFATR